jgi:DnaJ-class molecular chaperone
MMGGEYMAKECETCDGTGVEEIETMFGTERVKCEDCGGRGY